MRDVNNENTSIQGGFVCSSPGLETYGSQDLYNPVYEELCNGNNKFDDCFFLSVNLLDIKVQIFFFYFSKKCFNIHRRTSSRH